MSARTRLDCHQLLLTFSTARGAADFQFFSATASLIDNTERYIHDSTLASIGEVIPGVRPPERPRAAHTHLAPARVLVLLAIGCVTSASQAQDRALVTGPGAKQLPAFMKERSGQRNPNEIRWQESMWSFFGRLADMEVNNPTSAQTMLEQTIGLDTGAAQKLVAHVMQAKQDERTNLLELAGQQSSKVPQGTPSATSLAGMLKEVNPKVAAQRARSPACSLVDPQSPQKVRPWSTSTSAAHSRSSTRTTQC